jgi:hypothetical protein
MIQLLLNLIYPELVAPLRSRRRFSYTSRGFFNRLHQRMLGRHCHS